MDEDIFECYSEWANDELIWGRGNNNWCRAYSLEEWNSKKRLPDLPEIPEDAEIFGFRKE